MSAALPRLAKPRSSLAQAVVRGASPNLLVAESAAHADAFGTG